MTCWPTCMRPLIRCCSSVHASCATGVGSYKSLTIASRFAFFIRKILLNDKVPDTGCALKIFKKSDFLMLPFFNHIHRFFPILFKAYGGKVISVKVSHRRRLNGNSKYSNLSRALAGIYDIFGVLWLRKRSIIARIDK